MPFLSFYYITSSFLTVLAMVVFVSSLFSCFLPVSRWGKTSSSIWRKIQFFSWFFHLVMTWFSYCFSVTELTMQTVLPSDKSLAFYYLWNLVSKFVTTLSWKHRSVMTDGTNRDFFCPMQQLNFEDVTLILHSRPRRAGLDWMKDDLKDVNCKGFPSGIWLHYYKMK